GRILARFHFALNDGGILFLGRAETLLAHGGTFQPIDVKRRISSKLSHPSLAARDRVLLVPRTGADDPRKGAHHDRLREIALDTTPATQMVVDTDGALVLVNERARSLFGLGPADIGRLLQDLKISYRPV